MIVNYSFLEERDIIEIYGAPRKEKPIILIEKRESEARQKAEFDFGPKPENMVSDFLFGNLLDSEDQNDTLSEMIQTIKSRVEDAEKAIYHKEYNQVKEQLVRETRLNYQYVEKWLGQDMDIRIVESDLRNFLISGTTFTSIHADIEVDRIRVDNTMSRIIVDSILICPGLDIERYVDSVSGKENIHLSTTFVNVFEYRKDR